MGISPDGNTAYLAAWGVATCKYNGVHVVDIADPAKPREVSFIPSKEGSYPGEGVQALSVSTPAFTGDILHQQRDLQGQGRVRRHEHLRRDQAVASHAARGGRRGHHRQRPGQEGRQRDSQRLRLGRRRQAYAVIVDNEEGKDVDILDITDPRNPELIAEYDLDMMFPQIKQAAPSNLIEIFLHDMVVKEIGGKQVMMLSYWDAGYVKIDVTNPLIPTYIADTDFTNPDPLAKERGLGDVPPEGNGHQAEFTADDEYVVGADEDFAPYALLTKNVTDGTDINASQGSGTRKLTDGEEITGPSVFVGRACLGDAAVPPGGAGTQIAVVERGVCTFTEKVASVIAAGGYEAVLVFNREGSGGCGTPLSMSVQGDIPAFGVAPRAQGFALFNAAYNNTACLAGDGTKLSGIPIGTAGDTLTFSSYFDGWGYVHLFKNTGGKMAELDTYAIPEAHDPAFADGFGDLSVHEVATSRADDRLLYFSYYSGGFRVARITPEEKIEEVGRFIDDDGSDIWGVEVFSDANKEYVAASDRNSGLVILKYAP